MTVPDENEITTYTCGDAEGAADFSREPEALAGQARWGLPAPTRFARHDDVDAVLY